MFPTYLPFAFDPNGRLNDSDEITFGDSLTFWGHNGIHLTHYTMTI